MVARHLSNTVATTPEVQAHILYHWLTYVNGFLEVESSGSAWTPTDFSGSTGVVQSLTPQQFYDANTVFDATFVGKHIAIKDSLNPENCFVAEITAFVSATQITLDSTAVLSVDATDVEYVVFDTSSPPSAGDFFVIQTPRTTGPQWQARCTVGAAPASLHWDLGFIGGWDIGTGSWTLPVSSLHYMHDSMQQLFCVTDPDAGFVFLWSEDPPGGAAANRHALWLGALSPFHSPVETGVPKDLAYSAIFGSTNATPPADNLSRDTATADNFCVGEMLNTSSAVVPAYIMQNRLLSSGTDVMTISAASVNPRSMQQDDYDAVVFHVSPDQAWRGRLTAVRTLNDIVANRTPLNSNGTYVLGNGIGCSWNGKAPLP